VRALLVVLLVLLAGAGAWWFLAREAEPPADIPEGPSRERGSGPSGDAPGGASPPIVRAEPAPPPVDREKERRWRETRLVLPPEGGVVTGKDLLAAVESAGLLTVKAGEEDLAALRETRFPEIPRNGEMYHAVLEPVLRQAGFDLAVSYPTLHLRRRPPPREPARN
jgi:hypothetical protein